MYLNDLGDPTKMVNLIMDHTQFTQAYVKTAIKEQHKLYDFYNHSNDCGACYVLLDSLDATFKTYNKACLPDDFCFKLVWIQVIKSLQSDITAGIWDDQLCSSILSTLLLTDGNGIYHHSLITMKATLEGKLKKVRFMEHATGNTHLHNKGLTYTNISDLAKTQYQEALGVGKWPPPAHAKDSEALPSTFRYTLNQCFQKGQTTSKPCNKSNDTCHFVEKKDFGPMNVQTRLTLQ